MDFRDHLHIVFCSDHYNPLGVVRSLGEEGIKPIAILVSNEKPHLVNNSKYLGRLHLVETIDQGFQILITNYGDEEKKPFIYTCSDDIESYVDHHYDGLISHFYFFNSGEQGRVSKIMEKNVMCMMAAQCGLETPKTEEVVVGTLPKTMTKSIISTIENWKENVHICYNEQELKEAYKSIRGNKINVQEFIKKKNELCIDGLSINGGDEIYMPIQSSYIRFTPQGYGNYILFEKFKEDNLFDKIHALFKLTNFSGIFSIEFLKDENDKYYFLEINFRNSTWSYAHTKMGVNLPVIYAKSVLSGHLDVSCVKHVKVPFTAMSEFSDFGENVKTGIISIFHWLNDVRRCGCLFTYNKEDNKPFWSLLCFLIKKKKKKKG